MPIATIVREQAVPEAGHQIALCYNNAGTVVWLELTNFDFMFTNSCSNKIETALIGATEVAVQKPFKSTLFKKEGKPGTENVWSPIDRRTADANREHQIYIESDLGPKQIFDFQMAIIRQWSTFSHATASEYAKGTTFGKSLTSASFVAKALKTGFDAIGITRSAYSGMKITNWSVKDLLKYVNTMSTPSNNHGFTKYYPHPYYVKREEPGRTDKGNVPTLLSSKPEAHFPLAYEDYFNGPDGKAMTGGIKRVTAYGFRGDNRPPEALAHNMLEKNAGGLWPNATRPDHLEKAKMKTPEKQKNLEENMLHLGEHIKDQFYKGFVSVSRSTLVAKKFSQNGYVYAIFAQGAFDVPNKGQHTFAIYNEQELAMPGGLDWKDVVGYRKVKNGLFTGPVFLKREFFNDEHSDVLTELYLLLSGKTPGEASSVNDPLF